MAESPGRTKVSDTQVSDTQASYTQAGDTQAGDTQAGDTQASEVIPAGHAALARERRRSADGAAASPGIGGLGLAALGIVFGDIGTSPIYTFRECFNPEYGHGPDPAYVLGVLSLIAWALIVVVAEIDI
jgi:hypothetical protein